MTQDEKYMEMALKLAVRGVGQVEPNPAVGCVIVKAHQVIGKGYHKKFGDKHAEVNAIEDCKNLGAKPKDATMYVTLEPCCHIGKTGPCSEAIIAAGLKKVFVAVIDPADHAAGKGIEQLREAKIEVEVGTRQKQAELINPWYFKFARTGRPWVVLKWAQSIDAKLAWQTDSEMPDKPEWISNDKSRKDAHKLRRASQGILVGVNTVIADNPELTARPAGNTEPFRVVLDSNLRIPTACKLLKTVKKSPVLVMTTNEAVDANREKAQKIENTGAQLVYVPKTENGCDLEAALRELGARGIQQLLIEGGPKVIASFLKQELADAVKVYIAPKILGRTGTADINESTRLLNVPAELFHVEVKDFDGDVCVSGFLAEEPF
jgi:diaminohydroxyphosphoribosylaminopyrimidine deaminase/5-amino-6-(5-phosphoribosylamino)uracil reductase